MAYEIDGGRIEVHIDSTEEDFHVDAKRGYSRVAMRYLLDRLAGMGYHPIPEEECEPELLENGATRIYLWSEEAAYGA